jgi:lipopolysaccharide transport system ATP-binding protein
MSDTVIKVENLSKKYILSHQQQESYIALRDVMTRGMKIIGKKLISPFTSHFSPFTASREEFYALKDVSFEIKQGDRLGIIGRNGAGKSTLLKILSRITEPTSGRVEITGRVASLLEVGTGFHNELTGRENIFLNGAILGMSRAEIKRKFDEIVDFAEVEKFLDTPVKHYSSGMYVRLAFAIAAHLEQDILVVDEVMAVGDAQFQKKCLGKMENVSRSEGRTVLFVSHNLTAIQNLCSTGMYLHKGSIIEIGKVNDAVEHYLKDRLNITNLAWHGKHVENEFIQVNYIRIVHKEKEGEELFINEDIQLEISTTVFQEVTGIAFEISVCTGEGIPVFNSFTEPATLKKGNAIAACIIPRNLMNNRHYTVTMGISKNYTYFIVEIKDALTIELLENHEGLGWQGDWNGVVRPKLVWDVRSGLPGI